MKTFLKSSVFVAILMLFATLSFAQNNVQNGQNNQNPPMQMKMQGCRGFGFIQDLTEDQQAKIDQFHSDLLQNTIEMRQQLQIKQIELNSLITSNADLTKKQAKINEISDLKGKMQLEHVKYLSNVRSILNKNQQVEFDNWVTTRPMGKGRGFNGNNGMGNHGGCGMGRGMGYGKGYGNGYGMKNGHCNGNGPRWQNNN